MNRFLLPRRTGIRFAGGLIRATMRLVSSSMGSSSMKHSRWIISLVLVVVVGGLVAWVPGNAAEPPKGDAATWDSITDKAVAYLKKDQADDGSWSKDRNIGITGVVLTGLLQSGKVKATDP